MARRSKAKKKETAKPAPASDPGGRQPRSRSRRGLLPLDDDPAWRWGWAVGLACVVLSCVLYQGTLGHDFLRFDDRKYIYENPLIVGRAPTPQERAAGQTDKVPQGLLSIWGLREAEVPRAMIYPLTYTTFWVEHALVGITPEGQTGLTPNLNTPSHPLYRWTQMVLHGLNGAAILFALRFLGVGFVPAVFVSLVFTAHPVCVPSVAWLSERKNTMSTLFFFLSVGVYCLYRRQAEADAPRDPHRRTYVGALFLYLCALLSKTTTITLGPVLVITDRLLDGRWTANALKRAAPFLFIGFISGLMTKARADEIAKSGDAVAFLLKPFYACSAAVRYIAHIFWPVDQALVYTKWPETLAEPRFWICTALLGAATVVVWRYHRWLGDAWLWAAVFFFLTIGPVVGILQFTWTQFSAVSDHYVYLPMVGILLCVGLLVGRWVDAAPAAPESADEEVVEREPSGLSPRGVRKAVVFAAMIPLLGLLAWRTTTYQMKWKDDFTLWSHNVETIPGAFVAWFNLGNHYSRLRNPEMAVEHYGKAAAADTSMWHPLNRGAANLLQLNRGDEAVEWLAQAADRAQAAGKNHWTYRAKRADYLRRIGRREEALAAFEAIEKARPATLNEQHRNAMTQLRRQLGR